MKCDTCKYFRTYSTGPDEYPPCITQRCCKKDHWFGDPNIEFDDPDIEEGLIDPWANCVDYEENLSNHKSEKVRPRKGMLFMHKKPFYGLCEVFAVRREQILNGKERSGIFVRYGTPEEYWSSDCYRIEEFHDICDKVVKEGNPSKIKEVPQFFYHGTKKEKMKDILEKGLDPKYTTLTYGKKAVYLTGDVFTAVGYSRDHLVFRIDTSFINPALLRPDDYELVYYLNNLEKDNKFYRRDWNKISWKRSLEWVNQVRYVGIIPPEALSIVEMVGLPESLRINQ